MQAPSGCDLACPFCFIDQRQEAATRDNVVDYQYVNGSPVKGFEPLSPESFIYTRGILASGERSSVPTSLVTNGTHLRQHVSALSKLRPMRIAVSLDSADPTIHDKARGKVGAFDDTLAGLKFAFSVPALKKALIVTSILMPQQRSRLTGMPALLSELGIDRWVVNALIKVSKADKLGGPASDCHAILDDLLVLKAKADRYGIDMVVDEEFGRLSEDGLSTRTEGNCGARCPPRRTAPGCLSLSAWRAVFSGLRHRETDARQDANLESEEDRRQRIYRINVSNPDERELILN